MDALDSRYLVKAAVKAEDSVHVMVTHHGHVQGVASRKVTMRAEQVLRPLHVHVLDGQHLIDDRAQRIECRLDRVAAANRSVTVEDFLEDLRVGYEPLPLDSETFEQPDGIHLEWVIGADEILRNVGIDQDHV